MGYYLDGRVSAVLGTHTHVQTADERILPKGTAYITDAGMCGGKNSVLGVKKEIIIQKFLEANKLQGSLPEVSFNNAEELGSGKELVDKVSGLIAVFQNPAIDFKYNRASGDDIIGDAYEYFMMKFAQESGKSKGQFYTPSEVSRTIARLIGIGEIKSEPNKKWTLYEMKIPVLIKELSAPQTLEIA